jgi:hypothetical protein
VAGAALIAIVASTMDKNSVATNSPLQTDTAAAISLDSMLIGSGRDTVALTPPATGTLPDSVLLPAVARATLGVSSTAGSGTAVIVEQSGLALTAASLIPADSVVHVYVGPDRMARGTVVTIERSTGIATLLVPMQHCPRCRPLQTSPAPAVIGDSVLMLPPLRRGLGRPVRGAVSSLDAQALSTSLTLRRTTSAPVVSARTGQLLALSVGTRLSTTTMLQDAIVRAKGVRGRVASDSLFPTWPDAPMPTSRLSVQAVANTEASIASYQLPSDDITVLVMTPQVMKFRSREATFNPMAIQTPSKDPIAQWAPWSAYVSDRRAVVILDAAGNRASFPFTSGSDRRSDIRAIRLYRGDTLVAPIEAGRYPSEPGGSRSVPWSRVAVYSPFEFRPRSTYRVEVDDARQRTVRLEVKIGTLEALRRDLDVVLR